MNEKPKVKVKVINADWEIRKYNAKKRLNEVLEFTGNGCKYCIKAFMTGAGFATVFIIKRKLRDSF